MNRKKRIFICHFSDAFDYLNKGQRFTTQYSRINKSHAKPMGSGCLAAMCLNHVSKPYTSLIVD